MHTYILTKIIKCLWVWGMGVCIHDSMTTSSCWLMIMKKGVYCKWLVIMDCSLSETLGVPDIYCLLYMWNVTMTTIIRWSPAFCHLIRIWYSEWLYSFVYRITPVNRYRFVCIWCNCDDWHQNWKNTIGCDF